MLTTQTDLLPVRTVTDFLQNIDLLTKEIQNLYCLDDIPWVIGYSGGKDSTAVLQLVWNAIAALPANRRHKLIHVITTDTGVENPFISTWVRKSLQRIETAATGQNLPFKPHLLRPALKHTYWVSLIGKGYPAPRLKFRWCTGNLKIDPSNQFIRNVIRTNGEAILILGIRKAESSKRAKVMKKLEERRVRERLSPNANLPNSLVYSPIENWLTKEVWMYLMQWENPWGNSNKDLFTMYRGATVDNECPLVVDTSTPSCGSSRFGCWVCTMVDKDTSLEAMIQNDREKEWLQPLVDFRAELDIFNDRDKRDFRRLRGSVQLFERNLDGKISIEPIPGPYTKKWRENWLRKLLQAEAKLRKTAPPEMRDITLITPEELSEIRRIWLEEKHEFDDRLPQIYEEVTGEPFQDANRTTQSETPLLGADEWSILKDLCDEDEMYFELTTRLLDIERQYYTKSKRSGIIGDLEKCFDTSSRSQAEAIQNAHQQRDIQKAIDQADVSTLQQQLSPKNEPPLEDNKPLPEPENQTWGSLKFPTDP
ncbi:MAG: DNA phosphorothioation system sulfurtransferase DndC [Cyanobacteria bacterium SBLK]|nr:DNA phosphorothioation system sulfurtransferase DndC [Cyanobacteria bacterium SBLK]